MTWLTALRCPSCQRAMPVEPDGECSCSSCPGAIRLVDDIPVVAVRASQLEQVTAGLRASHRFNSEVADQDHADYTAHTVAIHTVLSGIIARRKPISPPRRLKVLDVGGGRGELAFLFADRFDTAMIDVDLDSARIARALQTDDRRFVVLCGDCSVLPLAAGSADIVLAKETAHHMPDPRAFFGELSRVAGAQGLILVVEGVVSSLANRERSASRDRMRQLGATHHHFELHDLTRVLSGVFNVSELVWAQPQPFAKILRRFGLLKLGEWLDRLWQYLPPTVCALALRSSGGHVVFACCAGARGECVTSKVGPAEQLVGYPIELASANPLSKSAIDRIRETLLN